MEKLFSPFTIKNITLKNRIVMPPLASFLIGEDGGVSDVTIEHYRRRAAGGRFPAGPPPGRPGDVRPPFR